MFIIILASAVFLTILLQSFLIMSSNKTEEQKYSPVRKYRDFEIRFYPSATVATISSNAKTYRDLSGPGFRQLAGYIFGGNETNFLKEYGIRSLGNYRFLGYNPPYQFICRRNEIIVAVDWKEMIVK